MNKKISILKKPSSRIVFRYCSIALIFLLACSILIPILLNYAPGSINTAFDVKMSYCSYTVQFIIIGFVLMALIFISTKLFLRDIDNWYENSQKNILPNNQKTIQSVRKKCFKLPYIIFLFEIIVPSLIIASIVLFTGSHHNIMIIKILFLVISFALLLAVFTYIFSKDIYTEILAKTYKDGTNIGVRVNLRAKIAMQILPVFISVLLLTSFVGYSRTVKEKEDIYYKLYHEKLISAFDNSQTYSIEQIKNILETQIDLYTPFSDSKFILLNGNTIVIHGQKPSNFMISYTEELSEQYNGRTYDSYGVDTQGATLKLNMADGSICYVCVSYSISSIETLEFLCYLIFALLIIISFVLYYFSTSISKDIEIVTKGLNSISTNSSATFNQKLPVISNDEFGDLTVAFNKVQLQNASHLEQLKSNQDLLMERERLASLGQLIGGIAHNLKTPIMSISGAAEGLKDLVKEYDSSIDDPEVNSQDHHDIAKDMNEWIVKIKDYTEYMSDVITAVKGQAVALSAEKNVNFTVEELIKRVTILMRHELKNALIDLNINLNVPNDLIINGDINSLVQVINNMISNAIQAYNGKTNECIDLNINTDSNTLIITIKDYGSGMSEQVKNKLFKEMITTKGKNGTGLGLFMSYSNIRAHFNGNITFESEEGKGTSFHIILPL